MAAFTQKELEISNKSYTNKDFEAVYTELLTYAQKLSTRFSPVNSNEADPFVILLKLAAFVADKVNYNVDKNILERFMLSCTQERSMRELTSMLGYNMHYYRAAETEVLFKYNFPTDYDGSDSIIIPEYSIVTNGDSIQYVTTAQTAISKSTGLSTAVTAIQGKLKPLMIADSKVIQLENLNADNIVYFGETMVAENGVFVTNSASSEVWRSVYNLNTEVYGSAVYKFGFDSIKNLPYLEFPDWVGDIIADGLTINYIVTDGVNGNVAAKELKTVSRVSSSDDIKDADIIVQNSSAAISGGDPETLDKSYKGFKKIIGTFDTLVTCRDYANKIYNLLNTYGTPYVSNVQIGDRRCDINYSCDVVTAADVGSQVRSIISKKCDGRVNAQTAPADVQSVESQTDLADINLITTNVGTIYKITDVNTYVQCKEKITNTGVVKYWAEYKILPAATQDMVSKIYNIIETDEYVICRSILKADSSGYEYRWISLSDDELSDVISPYDLCIYALKPISNTSTLAVDDENGYNKAFNLLSNTSTKDEIKTRLEEFKVSSHTYKELNPTDIASIRNYYKLTATVNTIRKINTLEEAEIQLNINAALIEKYNSRNLSFGYEIAFDELLKTIENADSRIKSVSLQEPEQEPRIVLANNTEIPLYQDDGAATDQFKFIVAKNILSGKVCAFKYDETFDYSYVYDNVDTKDNIILVSTECNIPTFTKKDSSVEYKLKDNETIQFLAPSLKTYTTYPYGINYYLKLASGDYISADSEYMLKEGDEFIVTYVDNNDETVIVAYTYPSDPTKDVIPIIKPNVALYTTAYRQAHNQSPTKIGISNLKYPTEYLSSTYAFYTLGTNDTVEYRKFVMETLDTFKRCYWLTNHPDNELPWVSIDTDTSYYILDDGEHFFYTDNALSSLYHFGAGTKLILRDSSRSRVWKHNKFLTVDTIELEGLAALGDAFISLAFNKTDFNMTIYENEIVTVTSGDTLEISTPNADYTFENNIYNALGTGMSIRYKFEGEETFTPLSDRSSLIASQAGISYDWQARAILDINAGPDSEQILSEGQKITFVTGVYDDILASYIPNPGAFNGGEIDTSNESAVIVLEGSTDGDPVSFKFNTPVQIGGGTNLNLQYLDLDLTRKCPELMTFTRDRDVANNIQDYGTGFYGMNFKPGEGETGSPEITRRLNTNPSRRITIKNLSASAIHEDPIASQADGSYYQVTEVGGAVKYYQAVRVCNTFSANSDEEHNALREDLHRYKWVEVDKPKTFDRYIMLYVSGINSDKQAQVIMESFSTNGSVLSSLQKINIRGAQPAAASSISLTNGINIIRIKDSNSGFTDGDICSNIKLTASSNDGDDGYKARNSIAILLGELRIAEGINPLLGLGEGDEALLAFLDYLKTNFPHQFTEFFMLADIDNVKELELTETYPLSSAQAFYDSNNIANKWTICKIDFTNSSIKVARSSKK